MKTLKNLNTFALFLPIGLGLLGFLYESMFLLAYLSIMLTGFIQVLVGLFYWSLHKKDKAICIYFIAVILYFATWYYNNKIEYSNNITMVLFIIPPFLAIYLTLIIHNKKENV